MARSRGWGSAPALRAPPKYFWQKESGSSAFGEPEEDKSRCHGPKAKRTPRFDRHVVQHFQDIVQSFRQKCHDKALEDEDKSEAHEKDVHGPRMCLVGAGRAKTCAVEEFEELGIRRDDQC